MNRLMFKVLIADDEYWIRENLRGILDWQAHSFVFIEPAVDGEQALEVIRQQHPDIVITDVNMPFMSGTELIERVGTEMPEIVFIALSGYSDYEFVRAALVAGAVDYLLKPISKGDLLKVLSKAVDRILESRAQKIELQTVQENLRIASSSALDRELSQLIYRTSDKKLHTQVQARLTSGYLAPFDESYYHFIRDEALDSVTVDGKVYGLPYNALYQGVYYNRELFNAHNVKVPENLAELQTAIDTFNANNIMPFATHMERPDFLNGANRLRRKNGNGRGRDDGHSRRRSAASARRVFHKILS